MQDKLRRKEKVLTVDVSVLFSHIFLSLIVYYYTEENLN